MKKYLLPASVTLAFMFSGAAAASARPATPHRHCARTFTLRMAERTARAVYAGRRHVNRAETARVSRALHCLRDHRAFHRVWAYDYRVRAVWRLRRDPTPYIGLASWFTDTGGTACGFHAVYGVANKSLPCGTRVVFRYGGREVAAVVEDRGPFSGSRVWDLNQNLAAALGFDGVGDVASSVPGG